MQNPEYARILAEENLELTDTQTKFVERIDGSGPKTKFAEKSNAISPK